MPPPQIFSLDGHAFGLTVSGVQVVTKVPTDIAPIRWQMPSASNVGSMNFTIMDGGETSLPAGAVVRLTDNVNNELLSSGVLVNRAYARHGGPWRRVDCEVAGWGWYLDHRIVTEYAWGTAIYTSLSVQELVHQFGGPLKATSPLAWATTDVPEAGGTVTRSTLRSAIESVRSSSTTNLTPWSVYVNDDAELRWWWSYEGDSALGTATYSLGDQGDFIPESLTYEVGSEDAAALVAVYTTAPAFVRWVRVGADSSALSAPTWDAGEASMSWVPEYNWTSFVSAAQMETATTHLDVTSVSFTTDEYDGWKPHQAVIMDDSMLTGGTAQKHLITSVSGEIDDRNVVTWHVTAGAPARSIVQTVTTK